MNSASKIIPFRLHPLGFIECFVNFGAQLDALLENTDISYRMIKSGEGAISYQQQDTLIENGLRLCQLNNLGLRVGSLIDWSYHGTAGSVVFCSAKLKDAWNIFFRFLCKTQPECARRAFEKSFYVNSQRRIVEPIVGFSRQRKKAEVAQFELEFMLAIGLRICELCGNRSIDDNKVSVSLAYSEPKDLSAYRALPCDDIKFSQPETTISAHVDFVNRAWRPFRQHSFDKLVTLCEQELKPSDINMRIPSRTRWLIGTNYFDQQLSLEDIAEKLHITPRALTRRLAKENTSFRAIYYEVRMEFTLYHLQKSDLSLEELANLMRFSSVASLRRAIKNYSGEPLAVLRRKVLTEHDKISSHNATMNHTKENNTNLSSTTNRLRANSRI